MATQEQVAQAIMALPIRLRAVFVRATVLRMPLPVIAIDLKLSRRQVERRMRKAIVACRHHLVDQ